MWITSTDIIFLVLAETDPCTFLKKHSETNKNKKAS